MTTRIPRHEVPADRIRSGAALVESTEASVETLVAHPHMFNLTLNSTLLKAKEHCAQDPEAAHIDTWEAWLAAMQIGSALFRSVTSTEPTVDSVIFGKPRTIPTSAPQSYSDAGNWLTAFYLALICREQSRLTELSNVPLSVLRDSGAEYDEYIYDWVDALQTYWKRGPDLGDKLVAAVEGTDPDRLQAADRQLMQLVLYPPLNLLFRLIAGDTDRFNVELAKAVEWHKEYWTGDEQRAAQPSGLVAVAPLALACLAYDGGVPIDVESDYLPKYLLRGGRVGDLET
ncbi:immunity 49 family protein [Streptomyces boluensis]|uniref:Immunity protein 49 n=1 Tax=Streptomyces boluensis TaxID=1775135 RepID=A0A964UYE0_9ACTN|nr:immunity 49 family protein [Streptomyces boluensis]NBE56525.1 hypothetical protein [Streptomyces boluensis]